MAVSLTVDKLYFSMFINAISLFCTFYLDFFCICIFSENHENLHCVVKILVSEGIFRTFYMENKMLIICLIKYKISIWLIPLD